MENRYAQMSLFIILLHFVTVYFDRLGAIRDVSQCVKIFCLPGEVSTSALSSVLAGAIFCTKNSLCHRKFTRLFSKIESVNVLSVFPVCVHSLLCLNFVCGFSSLIIVLLAKLLFALYRPFMSDTVLKYLLLS